MSDDNFASPKNLTAYLVSSGMVAEDKARDVECALTAFVTFERRRAFETARKAIDKALDKAR